METSQAVSLSSREVYWQVVSGLQRRFNLSHFEGGGESYTPWATQTNNPKQKKTRATLNTNFELSEKPYMFALQQAQLESSWR